MALPIPEKRPAVGFYYHYKHFGPDGAPNPDPYRYAYFVHPIGFHTEDDCAERDRVFQVYQPIYPSSVFTEGEGAYDLRPLPMIYEQAEYGGRKVDRFTKITDPEILAKLKARYWEMYPLPAELA